MLMHKFIRIVIVHITSYYSIYFSYLWLYISRCYLPKKKSQDAVLAFSTQLFYSFHSENINEEKKMLAERRQLAIVFIDYDFSLFFIFSFKTQYWALKFLFDAISSNLTFD